MLLRWINHQQTVGDWGISSMICYSLPSAGWEPVAPGRWTCVICRDSIVHLKRNLRRHLGTVGHKQAAEHFSRPQISELSADDAYKYALTHAPHSSDCIVDDVFLDNTPLDVLDIPKV